MNIFSKGAFALTIVAGITLSMPFQAEHTRAVTAYLSKNCWRRMRREYAALEHDIQKNKVDEKKVAIFAVKLRNYRMKYDLNLHQKTVVDQMIADLEHTMIPYCNATKERIFDLTKTTAGALIRMQATGASFNIALLHTMLHKELYILLKDLGIPVMRDHVADWVTEALTMVTTQGILAEIGIEPEIDAWAIAMVLSYVAVSRLSILGLYASTLDQTVESVAQHIAQNPILPAFEEFWGAGPY